jgi:hypothetical protein
MWRTDNSPKRLLFPSEFLRDDYSRIISLLSGSYRRFPNSLYRACYRARRLCARDGFVPETALYPRRLCIRDGFVSETTLYPRRLCTRLDGGMPGPLQSPLLYVLSPSRPRSLLIWPAPQRLHGHLVKLWIQKRLIRGDKKTEEQKSRVAMRSSLAGTEISV